MLCLVDQRGWNVKCGKLTEQPSPFRHSEGSSLPPVGTGPLRRDRKRAGLPGNGDIIAGSAFSPPLLRGRKAGYLANLPAR